jgi:hypothetical protein
MAFLVIVSGLEQYLAYKVGLVSGKFYEVLGNKDTAAFKSHNFYSLLLIGIRSEWSRLPL